MKNRRLMRWVRGVLSVLVAAIAAFGLATPALAQWPTTCVDLNDIVEAHLGNDGNVGIYQRTFGDQAEEHCRADHLDDVRLAFPWALGGSSTATIVTAWPTSCVALNDIAEAALGNHTNVGIYQRIFVHNFAAESACRKDHRDDVRNTFAWAVPTRQPPAASTPLEHPDFERVRRVAVARGADTALAHGIATFVVTQGNVDAYLRGVHQDVAYGEHGCPWRSAACPLAPEQPPSAAPDYERVREVALARGASPDKAAAVAASVVGRGQVDAFLRGSDEGVEYGLHICDWQSDACPLAPVYVPPPPPPEPQVDVALQPAWDLMVSTPSGALLLDIDGAATVKVRVAPRADPGVAWYRPGTHTISVSRARLAERRSVVASTLGHELWHAVSPLPHDRDYQTCIAEEVWAKLIGSLIWRELEGPWLGGLPSSTDAEANLTHVARIASKDIEDGATVDFDADVFDWLRVTPHVMSLYTGQCTRH